MEVNVFRDHCIFQVTCNLLSTACNLSCYGTKLRKFAANVLILYYHPRSHLIIECYRAIVGSNNESNYNGEI